MKIYPAKGKTYVRGDSKVSRRRRISMSGSGWSKVVGQICIRRPPSGKSKKEWEGLVAGYTERQDKRREQASVSHKQMPQPAQPETSERTGTLLGPHTSSIVRKPEGLREQRSRVLKSGIRTLDREVGGKWFGNQATVKRCAKPVGTRHVSSISTRNVEGYFDFCELADRQTDYHLDHRDSLRVTCH